MPSILNLKFKGNKSFVAFSNLNDAESLTKTWKVCTKVASYLEQGQRLENLSWRLWHLQNLMVDTDNAKSKREFKKLSKCMSDKLDKEKGRSIEELEAPDFRRNPSSEMIRQRAEERERTREANRDTKPGIIQRMQFTFSVDQPTPASNAPVQKPDLKPSPEFNKRPRAGARVDRSDDMVVEDDACSEDAPLTHRGRKCPLSPSSSNGSPPQSSLSVSSGSPSTSESSVNSDSEPQLLRFPSLFNNDFGPTALLYPAPSLTTRMNYGEGLNPPSQSDGFSVPRPTIELPLDELLSNVDSRTSSPLPFAPSFTTSQVNEEKDALYIPNFSNFHHQDVIMQTVPISTTLSAATFSNESSSSENDNDSSNDSDDEASDDVDLMSTSTLNHVPPISHPQPSSLPPPQRPVSPPATSSTPTPSQPVPKGPGRPTKSAQKATFGATFTGSALGSRRASRSNTPGRPHLTVRTQNTRSATVTNLNRNGASGAGGNTPTASAMNNTGPGGVKAECSNCGATHTPLWRRGLNDELNCNACGLYCKLHKRPRPKSMRNAHGEGRSQAVPRPETVDVVAQCYNCHTTATPLWRKDDEGKTVCNACGLYYKLHGSARPISMKSDIIRKRSRHDARRGSGHIVAETPSASPGVSRRASPARESSPTLAPDSSTSTAQLNYEYSSADDFEYHPTPSELINALGGDYGQNNNANNSSATGAYAPNLMEPFQFPGPYHPDHLQQLQFTYNPIDQALPFAGNNYDSSSDFNDAALSPRSNKRRRMSVDSASEPPSSAVSYSSYNDGYSSATSATSHSQRSSIDFPFSTYPSVGAYPTSAGPVFRGTTNPFWHPPMMPLQKGGGVGEHLQYHPPMVPPQEESPMDYLHPPLLPPDDEALFSTYLHPPMSLPDWSAGNGGDGEKGPGQQQQDGQGKQGGDDLSQLVYPGDYVMSDAYGRN
ncbi:hypothetical protein V5O48_008515 [Marasmius crinis-equi]|uniref:GATA-type domain-containing protein n=1 Tax=Marasmius crinis-equi TaxID=585013 RepID=A0ABR3FE13_9AGAR